MVPTARRCAAHSLMLRNIPVPSARAAARRPSMAHADASLAHRAPCWQSYSAPAQPVCAALPLGLTTAMICCCYVAHSRSMLLLDFNFGDAVTVFQDCSILARRPIQRQENTITAQGRDRANSNGGFCFQACTVGGERDLAAHGKGTVESSGGIGRSVTVQTYLGCPWKPYSRVIFMQTTISDVTDPKGWLPWERSSKLSATRRETNPSIAADESASEVECGDGEEEDGGLGTSYSTRSGPREIVSSTNGGADKDEDGVDTSVVVMDVNGVDRGWGWWRRLEETPSRVRGPS
ncbi:hypothetical protein C2845_PM04G20080 [Panicum miliaceum]|uniref:Pectinesterase catalytic domain-containing protein n=1 Tax=Panicum miliaceum TaxID=4540 RepID=A0A3L6QRU0_PANMI|nr:hypothetical protein C2845_PM04G20080 [Panicum miliaceum]